MRFIITSILFALSCHCWCQIDFDKANRAATLNNTAMELIDEMNYVEAENQLKKALQIDSTLRIAFINLHQIYMTQNKPDEAICNLKKALCSFQDDDELWYYLGNSYRKKECFNEALNAYKMAIEHGKVNGEDFPLTWSYHFNKANCLAQLKNYPEAIKAYSDALNFQPDNGNIYFNRGMSYLMMNDKVAAKADWTTAMNLGMKEAEEYIQKYCSK